VRWTPLFCMHNADLLRGMHNYAQLCEWVELANWMAGKRLVTSPRFMDWKWRKPRCMEWLAGQVVSLRLDRDRGQPFSGRFEMQCSQSFGKD